MAKWELHRWPFSWHSNGQKPRRATSSEKEIRFDRRNRKEKRNRNSFEAIGFVWGVRIPWRLWFIITAADPFFLMLLILRYLRLSQACNNLGVVISEGIIGVNFFVFTRQFHDFCGSVVFFSKVVRIRLIYFRWIFNSNCERESLIVVSLKIEIQILSFYITKRIKYTLTLYLWFNVFCWHLCCVASLGSLLFNPDYNLPGFTVSASEQLL